MREPVVPNADRRFEQTYSENGNEVSKQVAYAELRDDLATFLNPPDFEVCIEWIEAMSDGERFTLPNGWVIVRI